MAASPFSTFPLPRLRQHQHLRLPLVLLAGGCSSCPSPSRLPAPAVSASTRRQCQGTVSRPSHWGAPNFSSTTSHHRCDGGLLSAVQHKCCQLLSCLVPAQANDAYTVRVFNILYGQPNGYFAGLWTPKGHQCTDTARAFSGAECQAGLAIKISCKQAATCNLMYGLVGSGCSTAPPSLTPSSNTKLYDVQSLFLDNANATIAFSALAHPPASSCWANPDFRCASAYDVILIPDTTSYQNGALVATLQPTTAGCNLGSGLIQCKHLCLCIMLYQLALRMGILKRGC